MITYDSSLDQAGIVAKNARDATYSTKIICGYDPKDANSSNQEIPVLNQLW